MTPRQKKIYQFVYKNGETTKRQLVEEFGGLYYHLAAAERELGNTLSRMCKNKKIRFGRKRRGVYFIPQQSDVVQIGLFANLNKN